MFDFIGYIMKGFIYLWMTIIATIPNAFMGALTICIIATVLTYFMKKQRSN